MTDSELDAISRRADDPQPGDVDALLDEVREHREVILRLQHERDEFREFAAAVDKLCEGTGRWAKKLARKGS